MDRLPIGTERAVPPRAMRTDDQSQKSARLLLVGDAGLDLLRRALERAGHAVDFAQPSSALDAVSSRTSLAVLTGRRAEILALCAKIKERFPAPFFPVLAMVPAPTRLPQEPTAPDAWLAPDSPPREVVMRVAELLRIRQADAEMVRLNAALAELAAENGVLYERARREADAAVTLLRELQHRVRNNLAAIQALLILERHRTPPRPLHEALDVAITRLRSMSALQDSLVGGATDADLRTLTTAIAQGVSEVLPGSGVQVEITGDAMVSQRMASALAVILNELLCNACRHGGASHVRLTIAQDGGDLLLAIHDDGAGVAADAREGSGWTIVRTVVRNELGGEIELPLPGSPASVRLRVPASGTSRSRSGGWPVSAEAASPPGGR